MTNSRSSIVDPLPAPYPPTIEFPLESSPRAATMPRVVQARRADILATLTLLFLTSLVAWQRIWFWDGLAYLDVATFYLPWYAHLGEALRSFDLPGWNPYLFSGVPFAGDPQSGWMYLPAMLFFTILKPVAAYQWYLAFHLILAAISTYIYARVLRLRPFSSLVAAAGFTFSPLVSHISCCLIHVQLAVWIPPALLGVEVAAQSFSRAGRVTGLSLTGFAVSQMLAAWIGQGAYNGMLVVAAYIVFRVLLSPYAKSPFKARFKNTVIAGSVVFGIGIGLAAGGLLPRLDAVRGTNVSGGDYSGSGIDTFSSGWSLPLLFDRMFGDGHNYYTSLFYLGASTLTLVFMAVVLVRRNFAAPFFFGLTIVASILSLDHHTIVHRLFFLLPRYEVLREHVPTRVNAVIWLGPAMLAAATVEAVLRGPSSRNLRIAGWFAMGAWAVMILRLIPGYRTLGVATLALVAVICHAAVALSNPKRLVQPAFRTAFAVFMLVAVIWDPTGRTFVRAVFMDADDPVVALPSGPVDRDAVPINVSTTDPGGAGEFLQEKKQSGEVFRFYGYDPSYFNGGWNWPTTYREFYWDSGLQSLLVNARPMSLQLDDVQGYNPVQLEIYVNALTIANHAQQNYHDAQVLPTGITSPILDMLNVRYIVIPNDLPPGRPREDIAKLISTYPEVFHNESVRVLENPNALPRAWAVHSVVRASGDYGLVLIDSGLVDPSATAFLESDADLPSLSQPAGGATEDISVNREESDNLTLTANMAADGLVVVSEVYADGWNAYVDGKKTSIYLANGVIRAVAVPAGTHTIEFRYEPISLRLGVGISLATAVGLILTLMASWFLQRRSAPARSLD